MRDNFEEINSFGFVKIWSSHTGERLCTSYFCFISISVKKTSVKILPISIKKHGKSLIIRQICYVYLIFHRIFPICIDI